MPWYIIIGSRASFDLAWKHHPHASKICHKFTPKHKTIITTLNRVSRELLKIRHDILLKHPNTIIESWCTLLNAWTKKENRSRRARCPNRRVRSIKWWGRTREGSKRGEEWGKKEDHTVADQEENINEEKGELLVVRRDLISFQTNEEEPKDNTPHSKDENVTILASLRPLQISQKNPHKSPRQSSLFLTNQKTCFKSFLAWIKRLENGSSLTKVSGRLN